MPPLVMSAVGVPGAPEPSVVRPDTARLRCLPLAACPTYTLASTQTALVTGAVLSPFTTKPT